MKIAIQWQKVKDFCHFTNSEDIAENELGKSHVQALRECIVLMRQHEYSEQQIWDWAEQQNVPLELLFPDSF